MKRNKKCLNKKKQMATKVLENHQFKVEDFISSSIPNKEFIDYETFLKNRANGVYYEQISEYQLTSDIKNCLDSFAPVQVEENEERNKIFAGICEDNKFIIE